MTTTVSVPDWLKLHDGSLTPGLRPETTFVVIGGQPLYKLEVRPAVGKFVCAISNTVNGNASTTRTPRTSRPRVPSREVWSNCEPCSAGEINSPEVGEQSA
ncbi:MAG: hypothetical protein U0792_22105 [Gemmataceae bacterium]